MKRYGYLFDQVCSFTSLVKAAKEAARGKKTKHRVALFLRDLENEIISLENELRSKTYYPLPYRTFKIHDPKRRMICAADFRDRVVHHAICRVLEPVFEQSFIFDTYACRKGKGNHAAKQRAQAFSRRLKYFLKLDVHKFFDSIDHGVLTSVSRFGGSKKNCDFLLLYNINRL